MTPQELFELALSYYNGTEDIPQDYLKAYDLFLEAAETGHVGAQNQLAIIYCDENYTGYNETKALYWFLRAGQNGDTDAQCNLGKIYEN